MKMQYRSGWWIILIVMASLFLFFSGEEGMVVKSYFKPAVNIMNSKEREHLEEGMHVQMEIFYLEDSYETVRNGKNRLVSKTYMVPYMVKKDGEYIPTAMLSVLTNRFNYFGKTLEYCSQNNYQWVRQKAKPEYILQVDGYLREMTASEKEAMKEKHLRRKSEEEADEIIVPYVVCDYYTLKGTFIVCSILVAVMIFMIVREIRIQWIRRKPIHQQMEDYVKDNFRRVRDETNVVAFTKKQKRERLAFCVLIVVPICLLMFAAVGQSTFVTVFLHIFFLPIILLICFFLLGDLFTKYTYYEEKKLLVQKKLFSFTKRGYLESATRAYVGQTSMGMALKICFVDGKVISFRKDAWNNFGLIYELIDKYSIPYEENEKWEDYKKALYQENPENIPYKQARDKNTKGIAEKAKIKMPED